MFKRGVIMVNNSLILKYMNGNMNLFKKVASSFIYSYENFSKIYNDMNDDNLYRTIHSQKGVSLNLGLEDIYQRASVICSDLKNNQKNLDEIEEYTSLLDIAIDELKDMLKK